VAQLTLGGCVTTNLSATDNPAEQATLALETISSGNSSTRCMIGAIDGVKISAADNSRLTFEYLIPVGKHNYGFVCEESAGTIPIRDYTFDLFVDAAAGGSYAFRQQSRRSDTPCFEVIDAGGDDKESAAIAEYCL